jgi:hypothetical protein
MAEDKLNFDPEALERKIVMALETAPRVRVPENFAAQLAANLPPRSTWILRRPRYGVRAASVCLVVLIGLMLAFSPKGGSLYWLSIQSIFCAQFVVLAVGLVAHRYRSPDSF